MIRSRLGLRAITLSLALAGLMAISASVAQADPNSYWLVNKVKVTTLLPELQGELENKHGTLLGEIGGVGIHILCTGATFVAGSHLLANGGILGKALFSGCLIFRLKVLDDPKSLEHLGGCVIPGGHITTNLVKGLIKLHKLEPSGTLDSIVLFEPQEGTTFTTINAGEECAFGENIVIGGKFAVRDCNDAFLTDQVVHLVQEFLPLTVLFINGNPKNKAEIDGSVNVSLANAHKGLTWSGHPE